MVALHMMVATCIVVACALRMRLARVAGDTSITFIITSHSMASTSCLNSLLVVAVDTLLCFRGRDNINVSVVADPAVVQM